MSITFMLRLFQTTMKEDMDDQDIVQMLARMLAEEAGRNNALAATVVGVLVAFQSKPEVAEAVRSALERQYSDHLAVSQNPMYMDGFERARDLMYAATVPE